MNWLIKQLANEKQYLSIFLAVTFVYAVLGMVVVRMMETHYSGLIKLTAFLFMGGAVLVAYVMRMLHNLAYAKVHGSHE